MMIPLFQRLKDLSGGANIFDYSYVSDVLDYEPVIGSVYQGIVCVLLLIFGASLVIEITNKYKIRARGFYFILYFYHLAISAIYYYLCKNALIFADNRMYYMKVIYPDVIHTFEVAFKPGTSFILSIVNFLVHQLGFNYFLTFLIFSVVGFWGIMIFLKTAYDLGMRRNHRYLGIPLLPLFLFLPNIHLWTTAVGKDALIFFAIMLLTRGMMKLTKRWFQFLLGCFIVFMIRPHVAVVLFGSILFASVLFSNLRIPIKALIFVVFGSLSYILLGIFLRTRFGLSGFDILELIDLMDSYQGYYVGKSYSDSSVNLSNAPIPVKMFSYIFRPFPLENGGIFFNFSSIENMISLVIFTSVISKKFIRYLKKAPFIVKFNIVYFLLGVGVLSYIMSNFGIALRQKTMFLFNGYIVVFAYLATKNKKIDGTKT